MLFIEELVNKIQLQNRQQYAELRVVFLITIYSYLKNSVTSLTFFIQRFQLLSIRPLCQMKQ